MSTLARRCAGVRPCLLLLAAITFQTQTAQADTVGATELARWLATGTAAQRYGVVRESLSAIIASADLEGLPSLVLVERLKEGAAKGAPPPSLVAAGQADLDRLRSAGSLLRGAGAVSLADPERVFRAISLGLRAGLSEATFASLLGDSGGTPRMLDRSLAACETLLGLTGLTDLSQEELVRLGRALIAGKVPEAAWGSIVAVFAKGRAGKLDDGEILSLVTGVLERGGGMIQISGSVEAEARRRSRAR